MSNKNKRLRAIAILHTHENESPSNIHNAIVDLRRNAVRGDEAILRPFLEHCDPVVVAATLYTLFEVHDQRVALRPLVENFVLNGDARDFEDLDAPIQCMSIELLASFGKSDHKAVTSILQIADDPSSADCPRATAWERLAHLFDADWPADATEEMLLRPESEACEQLRNNIRKSLTAP